MNKKYTYTDNSLISEEKPAKKKTVGFSRWQRWVAGRPFAESIDEVVAIVQRTHERQVPME